MSGHPKLRKRSAPQEDNSSDSSDSVQNKKNKKKKSKSKSPTKKATKSSRTPAGKGKQGPKETPTKKETPPARGRRRKSSAKDELEEEQPARPKEEQPKRGRKAKAEVVATRPATRRSSRISRCSQPAEEEEDKQEDEKTSKKVDENREGSSDQEEEPVNDSVNNSLGSSTSLQPPPVEEVSEEVQEQGSTVNIGASSLPEVASSHHSPSSSPHAKGEDSSTSQLSENNVAQEADPPEPPHPQEQQPSTSKEERPETLTPADSPDRQSYEEAVQKKLEEALTPPDSPNPDACDSPGQEPNTPEENLLSHLEDSEPLTSESASQGGSPGPERIGEEDNSVKLGGSSPSTKSKKEICKSSSPQTGKDNSQDPEDGGNHEVTYSLEESISQDPLQETPCANPETSDIYEEKSRDEQKYISSMNKAPDTSSEETRTEEISQSFLIESRDSSVTQDNRKEEPTYSSVSQDASISEPTKNTLLGVKESEIAQDVSDTSWTVQDQGDSKSMAGGTEGCSLEQTMEPQVSFASHHLRSLKDEEMKDESSDSFAKERYEEPSVYEDSFSQDTKDVTGDEEESQEASRNPFVRERVLPRYEDSCTQQEKAEESREVVHMGASRDSSQEEGSITLRYEEARNRVGSSLSLGSNAQSYFRTSLNLRYEEECRDPLPQNKESIGDASLQLAPSNYEEDESRGSQERTSTSINTESPDKMTSGDSVAQGIQRYEEESRASSAQDRPRDDDMVSRDSLVQETINYEDESRGSSMQDRLRDDDLVSRDSLVQESLNYEDESRASAHDKPRDDDMVSRDSLVQESLNYEEESRASSAQDKPRDDDMVSRDSLVQEAINYEDESRGSSVQDRPRDNITRDDMASQSSIAQETLQEEESRGSSVQDRPGDEETQDGMASRDSLAQETISQDKEESSTYSVQDIPVPRDEVTQEDSLSHEALKAVDKSRISLSTQDDRSKEPGQKYSLHPSRGSLLKNERSSVTQDSQDELSSRDSYSQDKNSLRYGDEPRNSLNQLRSKEYASQDISVNPMQAEEVSSSSLRENMLPAHSPSDPSQDCNPKADEDEARDLYLEQWKAKDDSSIAQEQIEIAESLYAGRRIAKDSAPVSETTLSENVAQSLDIAAIGRHPKSTEKDLTVPSRSLAENSEGQEIECSLKPEINERENLQQQSEDSYSKEAGEEASSKKKEEQCEYSQPKTIDQHKEDLASENTFGMEDSQEGESLLRSSPLKEADPPKNNQQDWNSTSATVQDTDNKVTDLSDNEANMYRVECPPVSVRQTSMSSYNINTVSLDEDSLPRKSEEEDYLDKDLRKKSLERDLESPPHPPARKASPSSERSRSKEKKKNKRKRSRSKEKKKKKSKERKRSRDRKRSHSRSVDRKRRKRSPSKERRERSLSRNRRRSRTRDRKDSRERREKLSRDFRSRDRSLDRKNRDKRKSPNHRSYERVRSRSRDQRMSRSRSRERKRSRERRSRDMRSRSRDRRLDRHRSQERRPSKSKDKKRNRSKERDRSKGRGKDRLRRLERHYSSDRSPSKDILAKRGSPQSGEDRREGSRERARTDSGDKNEKSRKRKRSRSKERTSDKRIKERRRRSKERRKSRSPSRRERRRSLVRGKKKSRSKERSLERRRSRSLSKDWKKQSKDVEKSREQKRSRSPVRNRRSASHTRRSLSRRRVHSRSHSRRRSRSEDKIDKAKLLEAAKRNMQDMIEKGTLPQSLLAEVAAASAKPVPQTTSHLKASAGKSVDELTQLCRTISEKENKTEEEQSSSEEETNDAFINHPFKLREAQPSINFNINRGSPWAHSGPGSVSYPLAITYRREDGV